MKKIFALTLAFSSVCFSTSLFAEAAGTTKSTTTVPTYMTAAQPASYESYMNELAERKTQLDTFEQKGVFTRFGSRLVFSGGVDVYASASNMLNALSFQGPSNNALYMRTAFFDLDARLTHWLSTYISVTDEPNNALTTPQASPTPEFKEAYIKIKEPKNKHFDFILGRDYLPFGVYQRFEIISSLTRSLSEINRIAAIGNIKYHPFFVSVFAFNMPGSLNGFGTPPNHQLENGGAEIGAKKHSSVFGYNARVAVINNMAAIKSIYSTISSTNKAVDEIAAHVSFNFHRLGFAFNDAQAVDSFLARDITYNGVGAKPSAYSGEINYLIVIHNKPLLVAARYEHSSQSLFLNMANYRYYFSFTLGINKFLSSSLQFYRSKNYGAQDVATYATSATAFDTIRGNGCWSNAVILDLFAHF